jgi:hypothetical protein
MGSSEHGDGQVLPFSISAFWVSGTPGFDQRLHYEPLIEWELHYCLTQQQAA